MSEQWKKVHGWPYEVSTAGRVRRMGSGRVLKPYLNTDAEGRKEYLRVDLSAGGKLKKQYVHRLVAKAFVPNPKKRSQVHHKNSNGRDNRVQNLAWVTARQNIRYTGPAPDLSVPF
jgi:hypothetical protein